MVRSWVVLSSHVEDSLPVCVALLDKRCLATAQNLPKTSAKHTKCFLWDKGQSIKIYIRRVMLIAIAACRAAGWEGGSNETSSDVGNISWKVTDIVFFVSGLIKALCLLANTRLYTHPCCFFWSDIGQVRQTQHVSYIPTHCRIPKLGHSCHDW